MEEITLVVDDDESSIELEAGESSDDDAFYEDEDDDDDDGDHGMLVERHSLSTSLHARLHRSSGLMRTDGREACLAKSCPRLGQLNQLQPPRRLPARELKRRRPVNNNKNEGSIASLPQQQQPVVSEDSSTALTTDQAPACPRRERSMDQDEWTALDLARRKGAASAGAGGSPRLMTNQPGRRE